MIFLRTCAHDWCDNKFLPNNSKHKFCRDKACLKMGAAQRKATANPVLRRQRYCKACKARVYDTGPYCNWMCEQAADKAVKRARAAILDRYIKKAMANPIQRFICAYRASWQIAPEYWG